MIPNDNKPRRHFKQLEQRLTAVVLGDLVLFVLTLIAAANGIFWLKLILGLLTMAISCMGARIPRDDPGASPSENLVDLGILRRYVPVHAGIFPH